MPSRAPHVSAKDLETFEDEMRAGGGDWQFVAYDGAEQPRRSPWKPGLQPLLPVPAKRQRDGAAQFRAGPAPRPNQTVQKRQHSLGGRRP
ncbi:MAG: hypothetical protein ABR915_14870 [Thermoguttaceae bacterium]